MTQKNSFKHINTYTGAMNQDLSPRLYDNKRYFEAEWMTPINNETGTAGPMTNIKGTIDKFYIPPVGHWSNTHTIIGHKELRDKLIIISVDVSGYNYILEAIDDGTATTVTADMSGLGNTTTGNFRLLWTDNPSVNPVTDEAYKRLGYLSTDKLDIETKYENDDIQKVYIGNGTKPLRYFNIIYNATTNDYTQYTQADFNIVPDASLPKPTFSAYTTGNLPAGVNYYVYQLYRVNGVETAFSETSEPIVITSTVRSSDSTILKGSDLEENCAIGVTLSLQNLDSNYDRLRCYAIEYSEYEATPTIRLFFEGEYGSSSLSITDSGQALGTYDLAELRVKNQFYIIPTHLTSKNNMLFAANMQEKYFDLDEYLIESGQTGILTTDAGGSGKQFWDSRSYRFNNVGAKTATLFNNETDYMTLTGPTPAYTSVPYNYACYNKYNKTEDNSNYYDNPNNANKRKVNGGLGAEGQNITISFGVPNSFTLDSSAEYQIFKTAISNESLGRKKGWQEDEVYRLSVQFIDNKGRESFPKWITDLRMPDYIDSSGGNIFESGGVGYCQYLYPMASISNIPLNDDGTKMRWRILRVKRDGNNKTVLGEALISCTLEGSISDSGTGSHSADLYGPARLTTMRDYRTKTFQRYNNTFDTGLNQTHLQLYTPERFFSDINLDDCYLSHQGCFYDTRGYGRGVYRDDGASTTWTTMPSSYTPGTNVDPQILRKFRAYNPALAGTYYTTSSTRLVNIKSWKEVKSQPVANYDTSLSYYSIGSKVYINVNFMDNSNGNQGENGSCFIVETEAREGLAYFPLLTVIGEEYRIMHVLIKREGYPYGGYSFESRFNNIYIPASTYTNVEGVSTYLYYGDVITAYYDFLRTMYDKKAENDDYEGDEMQEILYVPLKSQHNLNLRNDTGFNKIANMARGANRYLTEEGLVDIDTGMEIASLYRYNTVYTTDNNVREYSTIPFDASTNYTYDHRIRRSEVKSNGEYSDSWLQFLPNNYIDVDGQYGAITRIDTFKDKLLFWQPKAMGTVPVGEKELIPSSNSSTLALGSSGILNRYDYIDDASGASTKDAIVITPTRILYFSSYRNTMYMYGGGQTQPVSDVLGMNSWFDQYVILSTNILSGYNPIMWETWFTFGNYTLVYNEKLNGFTYFVPTVVPTRYITFNNSMYTLNTSGQNVHKHNVGNYGQLHGVYVPSSITVLVNPQGTTMTIVDVIELLTEKYASNGTTELQETFDTIRIYNDYQDTGTITLTPDDNIKRRLRTWRFNTIRDDSVTSGDPKMRSSFVKIKLTFNNSSSNEKILLHNLTTNYRLSKMMG